MVNEGSMVAVEAPVQLQQPSFMESFKNAVQPESIARKLGIDKNTLIDIGIFGAIGFITGFLLKKYSEYFIACAFFVVGLLVLQHFGYIAIDVNVAKIHEMMGLPSSAIITEGYGSLVLTWTKSNVPAGASLVIGFLVGLKCA